jgi:hypothetical protein
MIKKINWLFLLFITTILCNFIYVNRSFYEIYILIFFSALFFLYSKSNYYKIVYDKKILLFTFIFIIESLTISLINIYYNDSYWQFFKFLLIYLIFFIIIILIKRYGDNYIKKFYQCFLYFLDVINIINIYEIINKRSMFYTLIADNGAKQWQVPVFGTDAFRTFSVFLHPIVYGNFLVCLFWVNIFPIRKNKIIKYISGILILVNLYFTQSRSSWIALSVTLLIYLINIFIDKVKILKFDMKINNIIKFICIILFIAFFSAIFNNDILVVLNKMYSKIITATSDNYNDPSRLQRLGSINVIYRYMTNNGVINFLFGNGLGSVEKFMVNNTVLISGFTTTDNQFMSFFYEFGFIGLGSYIIIIILSLVKLFKKTYSGYLYKLSTYVFISISINMFFYESYGWLDVFFMLIFSLAVMCISSIEIKKKEVIKNEN